jgi:elongation factor P--(R)-beta-lysine ligase
MSKRFLPTATLETLQLRSRLVASLRDFFQENGYWECETPILSREIIVDANLDPFITHDVTGSPYYLQTSPEAGMKRLLSAGATAIFQISRVMRRGESGQLHNPEFTMVEWYRVGDDHHDQMNFAERLVRAFYEQARQFQVGAVACECRPELPNQSFERLTYDEAFERFVGTRVLHLDSQELRELAEKYRLDCPHSLPLDDRDGWLNLLLAELVEPHLGRDLPQFVYDYPASQAALAKVRRHSPDAGVTGELPRSSCDVAERFELYDRGVELCNGYHELTDPTELSDRSRAERKSSELAGHEGLPGAPLLECALREGFPDCSGVALGLDRLVMIAIGKTDIGDVIAFPADRA